VYGDADEALGSSIRDHRGRGADMSANGDRFVVQTSTGATRVYQPQEGDPYDLDMDGDGLPNTCVYTYRIAGLEADTDDDGDGIVDVDDLDNDNDGVPDIRDAFPYDRIEWQDTDGDGVGNNEDTDDDLPLDSTEWLDTDGDYIGNNAD
jgi:hypothetical protein